MLYFVVMKSSIIKLQMWTVTKVMLINNTFVTIRHIKLHMVTAASSIINLHFVTNIVNCK